MGIFDSIKSAFGKAETAVEPVELAADEDNPPASVSKDADEVRHYTVVSGDTLWKIAQRMYGDGSRYMEIFEANTDVLEQPDHILPGQQLIIPRQ